MEGGGGGGEGGWELITWEAFCPAPAAAAAARMQMKEASRLGGKGDGKDGRLCPRAGWHGCTQVGSPHPPGTPPPRWGRAAAGAWIKMDRLVRSLWCDWNRKHGGFVLT